MRPKELKRRAISLLRNNWAQAIVIILVYIVVYLVFLIAEMSVYYYLQYKGYLTEGMNYLTDYNSVFSFIGIGRICLGVLFAVPIHIGAKWWYLHAARGEQNGVNGMFVCYGNIRIFLKTLWIKFSVAVLVIIPAAPLMFCVYAVFRLLAYAIEGNGNQGIAVIMAFFAGLLFICLGMLYIIYCMNFALTDYLFCLNPDLSVMEAIKLSVSMMKNYKRELVSVIFSYIGWIPVAMLIFPLLFLLPYFAMTFTVAVNQIIENGEASDKLMCPARKPKPAR